MASDPPEPKPRARRRLALLAALCLTVASCASGSRGVGHELLVPARHVPPAHLAPTEPTWSKVLLDAVGEIAAGLTHVRIG